MVSSVQPNSYVPLTPHHPQPRPSQTGNDNVLAREAVTARPGHDDSAARDALANAIAATDLALGAGREGAALLSQIRDTAREAIGADDGARADLSAKFQALLQRYGGVIETAIGAGAVLLGGGALSVPLGAGAQPVTIDGFDLRLKADPGAEDALRLSTAANLGDPAAAARDADASLARVDAALGRLSGSAQRLNAHGHVLAALDIGLAGRVDEPSDADGARLLALQISQSLQGANAAIANSAPQTLLALFREH